MKFPALLIAGLLLGCTTTPPTNVTQPPDKLASKCLTQSPLIFVGVIAAAVEGPNANAAAQSTRIASECGTVRLELEAISPDHVCEAAVVRIETIAKQLAEVYSGRALPEILSSLPIDHPDGSDAQIEADSLCSEKMSPFMGAQP